MVLIFQDFCLDSASTLCAIRSNPINEPWISYFKSAPSLDIHQKQIGGLELEELKPWLNKTNSAYSRMAECIFIGIKSQDMHMCNIGSYDTIPIDTFPLNRLPLHKLAAIS